MKLSNKFTLSRIIFVPFFVFIYFIPIWTGKFASLSMFIGIPLLIFAEITDYLDGHYARKKNEVSDFGKLFDPFADVMLHLTTFVCLMFTAGQDLGYTGYLPIIILLFILYREMSQNFLRMIAAKKGIAIGARKGGKFKTVMYVVAEFYALFLEALIRLNIVPEFFGTLKIVSLILFIICLICSYASFIDYLVHFGKTLKD